jgi:hypothetical protein
MKNNPKKSIFPLQARHLGSECPKNDGPQWTALDVG